MRYRTFDKDGNVAQELHRNMQFLCHVTFWKSFHSGSKKFSSDTDPAAAGAAAASAAASDAATAKTVVKTEAAAEASAAPAAAAAAASVSQ